MIYKVWRQAHMMLAMLASAVILIVAITGVVLAFDATKQAIKAKAVAGWDRVRLADLVGRLDTISDQEIISIKVTPHGEVHLEVSDQESSEIVTTIIDPHTINNIGVPPARSPFVISMQALHRSLFLDELGRIIVGLATFLFFLILLTGFVLLLKRYGIRGYFSPTQETNYPGALHVLLGRWLVLPLMLISVSASILFLYRVGILPQSEARRIEREVVCDEVKELSPSQLPAIQDITLAQVRSFEYPLFEDENEPYRLRLRDRELIIHPLSGEVVSEMYYPVSALLREWSWDVHTGRASLSWAVVLGLSAIATIVFIVTGLMMMIYRMRFKSPKSSGIEPVHGAEYVILVGSEHGTTLRFAEAIFKQWIELGLRAGIASLNDFESLEGCRYLVVFTCTYGEGEPPANARLFLDKLKNLIPDMPLEYSVVSFGSQRYPQFGAYGIAVDQALEECTWANRLIPLQLINNRSAEQLQTWAHLWSKASGVALSNDLEDYKLRRNK